MNRSGLALAFAAAFVAAVPAAQAKLPPDGVDLCGASACIHLTTEQSMPLWSGGRDVTSPLRTPSPFYSLRWRWSPLDVEHNAYYVPAANALRLRDGTWLALDRTSAEAFEAAAAAVSPHPVPAPTVVTVGAKQARGPETYLRLLQGPAGGLAPVTTRWITVTMRSEPASPWTDGESTLRLSARGRSRLVLLDGWVHRVPLWVANRARRGLPLTP
jgi:hypothetical protein